jgi:vacuolar-type H+-ATPase subunit C/Vma6
MRILKAVSVGLPHEKIISSIYLSVEEFLKRQDVIKQASLGFQVKSVVDALINTVYGPILVPGLQKYEETGSTKFFDFLLDKLFYEQLGDAFQNLSKKEQKHAFFYTSMEIDRFILLTILRAKILKYDSHSIRMVLPNTRARNISENIIEALLHADNFDLAFNRIQQSRYAPCFMKMEIPKELISSAERAFRNAMLEHFTKTKVGDQFNVNILLGLMIQKAIETQNLTAISVGIEYGWKQDQILHSLLFSSR